jgi:quinoprotein glucose dehydrogenase
VLAAVDPPRALRAAENVLSGPGVTVERQRAFALLAGLQSADADALLTRWVDRFAADQVPVELQLDLLEAAADRPGPAARLAEVREKAPPDPLGPYRPALAGGDAERGRAIFTGHPGAQCLRCHKVHGEGGDAGPDLTRVAAQKDRTFLLHSLLEPDRDIAPGFGTVSLVLTNGQLLAGGLKEEKDGRLTLVTPDHQIITVPVADIEERLPAKSTMPALGTTLKPREVRDLLEFLAGLK